MTYSCVIIGLGQIGMGYDFDVTDGSVIYTHARAIALHPEFRLTGAVDVSPTQRARFESRYGLPAFDELESAIKVLQPDIVIIATSTELHGSILRQVVNSCHPKLILCEKPLAYELDEARDMVEMCEKAGIELLVNYIRRADPGVAEIKRRIDNGEISTPLKVNVWYSKGILNNGSHFLNLLELWLGRISGSTLINPGRLWAKHDPEPDVEFQFEQGTAVFRSAWEEFYTHCSVELVSRSGLLRYERGGQTIEWHGVCLDQNFEGYRVLADQREIIVNGMGIYQWHVYDQIRKHLTGEATNLCAGRSALKTIEAIDEVIK